MSLPHSLRLYLRFVGVSFRSQMQYRASFIMMTVAVFMSSFLEFLGVWALFHRFGQIRGWSFADVAVLYGVINVGFAIADGLGRGFDLFSQMVKSGDFDRLLLRPAGTALQVAGQEVMPVRVGRLLQGAFVMGWGIQALGLAASPARMALLGLTILGAACLFYGLFVLQATLAFWTVESLEIMNTVTYGGTETGQYPLTIYRPWFRLFFTFVVPLAAVNYLPAGIFLGRPDLGGAPALVRWLSPLVGVAFLLVTLRLWEMGVRRYRSTGS